MPIAPTVTDSRQSIILLGPSGVGKTSFALQAPRPYLIDGEGNQRAALKVFNLLNKTPDWTYDSVLIDEKGKSVQPAKRWDRFVDLLTKFEKSLGTTKPFGETLVIDSITVVNDFITSHIRETQNIPDDKPLRVQDWGVLLNHWKTLFQVLRGLPCNTIFIGHETRIEPKDDNDQTRYELCLSGKAKDLLPAMFTDCWRMAFAKDKGADGKPTQKRVIMTKQTAAHVGLKSSIEMPDTWDATQEQLYKAFNYTKPTT